MINRTTPTLYYVTMACALFGALITLRSPVVSAQQNHAHAGHDHGDAPAIPVTVWTDRYEVFAEYPPLAANTPARFVTHITALNGFQARTTGAVTFVLQQGSQHLEIVAKAPARKGIYLPELTFPTTGTWTVTLQIPETVGAFAVPLGKVTVHPDAHSAFHAPRPAEIEGFGFLKEQQWSIPFQVDLVRSGDPITVPANALLQNGGETSVFVQRAGETFEKRAVHPGQRLGEQVQIRQGLKAGERIVTVGVAALAQPQTAEHAGHDHDAADDHHAHDDYAHASPPLSATAQQIQRLNLKVEPAHPGGLDAWMRVPGELVINHDTMAHMVPRAAGIVKEVFADLGEQVVQGQILAVIESKDLALAKAEYLALEQRLALARTQYQREERLHAKKISSDAEYLEAKQKLAENQIQLNATRQKLFILGIRPHELSVLAQQSEENFADYAMTAPFTGTIIRKHIVLGEAVDSYSEVFEIADLSEVWADLLVAQQDIGQIQVGQKAIIILDKTTEIEGTISYVDPVIHPETRAAVARVVLKNHSGKYRPGLFVTGRIRTQQGNDRVIVLKSSIQSVHDQTGVFVQGAGGFSFRPVTTGQTDQTHIEIFTGLSAGEKVVTQNAFHLKAEMTMGAADAHAGHGHAH